VKKHTTQSLYASVQYGINKCLILRYESFFYATGRPEWVEAMVFKLRKNLVSNEKGCIFAAEFLGYALSAETKKLEAIYQQKINDLEELKKSVLQKAFSGALKTTAVV
jgi:hypothetical protein